MPSTEFPAYLVEGQQGSLHPHAAQACAGLFCSFKHVQGPALTFVIVSGCFAEDMPAASVAQLRHSKCHRGCSL